MQRIAPFIELKRKTWVINEASNPCSFSPSLFNRINHVTMMSVSTSPNFFSCGYKVKCAKNAMRYTLVSNNHRCDDPHTKIPKFRLGQRVEFHHPVPFAAASARFPTHAASRVWSKRWLSFAYSRGIKKIEWYQRERLTLQPKSILWQSQHKGIKRMNQAEKWSQIKNVRNSLLC